MTKCSRKMHCKLSIGSLEDGAALQGQGQEGKSTTATGGDQNHQVLYRNVYCCRACLVLGEHVVASSLQVTAALRTKLAYGRKDL